MLLTATLVVLLAACSTTSERVQEDRDEKEVWAPGIDPWDIQSEETEPGDPSGIGPGY